MKSNLSKHPTKIGFVGNYLPRQCGIATFTNDLCESMALEYPLASFIAVAMNDTPEGYDYPPRVQFEVMQDDVQSYIHAAEFLNLQDLDLVSLQHEFGIFGGDAGSHILALLRKLKMPVVTTLHTVLADPNPDQRAVMEELVELSARLVVMSERGVEFLKDVYGVPPEKIDLIPHGIPDVPFAETDNLKKKLGLQGKNVLLTFGLLSPNKGIEYVLQALPAILEKHPDLVYIALGATHPHVKEKFGEDYRDSLKKLAHDLDIEDHVIFDDRFVSQEELVDYIGAADIYITPYLNAAQIVSGTLAYTIGAGKQVISTPYWYAEELLADQRGLIIPFRDAAALAENVERLLSNEEEGRALRRRAYIYGRNMIWPKVAERYMESFERARAQRVENPSVDWEHIPAGGAVAQHWSTNLPPINLRHLLRMTDSTGIYQHATYDLPNYTEGYCTDDNARALILALMLDKLNGDYYMDTRELTSRYLAFLFHAFNPAKGRFHNFLSFGREWLDDIGSEDSHGRALWALGTTLGGAGDEGLMGVAGKLFMPAIPAALEMRNPRSWAFSLLGIHAYLQRFAGDRFVHKVGSRLAERLLRTYNAGQRPGWNWFEEQATYNNATLSQALLLMGAWDKRNDMVQAGLESLQWLVDQQTSLDGHFVPIGNDGFYTYGGKKARFDQQPIEAGATVSACLDAFRITGERRWYQEAHKAFEWFLGRNDLGLAVYDPETGGCCDGLKVDRLNQNQGAESTLAYLMALTEMYSIQSLTPIEENAKHGYSLLFNRKPSSSD